MKEIKFDFNNLFSLNIGKLHGVTENDLKAVSRQALAAQANLKKKLSTEASRVKLSLEWAMLPFQSRKTIDEISRLGQEISAKYDDVLFLGIGGSYLGLKAAQDALLVPYYNDFKKLRNDRPRIYFEGNNLDPDTLNSLLKNLNPKKTFVVVISKSGETTETKAAFEIVELWLKKHVGNFYGRQIIAITDPESGTLRKKVNLEHAKDGLSLRSLPLLKGVGGRFSEFNMGLLHLAIIGVDIKQVLSGATQMAKRCSKENIMQNPAYLYALLHYLLYRKKGKSIAILMPFSESLKSTADWYVQLLAESLGKQGLGRTPVSSRGTNDLHSIQQNNIEGENNKVVTFIKLEKFKSDLAMPATSGILSGRRYSQLISLAQEATEWALVRAQRPNCTVILPALTPYYWGTLLFFFEMATAFEGELLKVNAFDQPGVEGYKNYMYYKLNKPGIPQEVISQIRNHPLKKDSKFIV
ncbi:MAG: glucose-6-phosphate isomerase [Candidatus Omnitrophica bacterium]|nr:glucose-6-phosphate isomerase [Candidatus Omnitrophota bacterium]MDD5653534.1 glucose-6-phosphate isomerase [Candidatus Omnitrophota bacterium]